MATEKQKIEIKISGVIIKAASFPNLFSMNEKTNSNISRSVLLGIDSLLLVLTNVIVHGAIPNCTPYISENATSYFLTKPIPIRWGSTSKAAASRVDHVARYPRLGFSRSEFLITQI